jgi:hypothetical protein
MKTFLGNKHSKVSILRNPDGKNKKPLPEKRSIEGPFTLAPSSSIVVVAIAATHALLAADAG